MSNRLYVSPSPHVNGDQSSQRIMLDVIIALVPALLVSALYFGYNTIVVAGVAIASSLIFEYAIRRYMFKEESPRGDLSPIVTGLLLAFNLPASIPLWIVVIGSLVSIGIAKMSFGGLGKNPFNPALVGRVFLLIAYPVQMTTFPRVECLDVDIFSGATPLAAMKNGMAMESIDFQNMLLGAIPGSLGEVSALLLIAGGAYLLIRKVITWHIPLSILATMFAVAVAFAFGSGYEMAYALHFSLFHILAGGALLGAIYMATDYTTSPMTHKGMVIYGVGIALITMFIRLWGAYPEGMSFAILIMNSCVPLINKYVKPRRFGTQK